MENHPENSRDLILLEQIEQNPDVTQASMAVQLGVAVGTINWHLKRLINKGYVKVRRAERRKLRYIITPEGIALRTHLTLDYLQTQFRLYRQTRQKVIDLLGQVRQAGIDCVQLVGEGDVADICRLTCLEQGISIVNASEVPSHSKPLLETGALQGADGRDGAGRRHAPVLVVVGLRVELQLDK